MLSSTKVKKNREARGVRSEGTEGMSDAAFSPLASRFFLCVLGVLCGKALVKRPLQHARDVQRIALSAVRDLMAAAHAVGDDQGVGVSGTHCR